MTSIGFSINLVKKVRISQFGKTPVNLHKLLATCEVLDFRELRK